MVGKSILLKMKLLREVLGFKSKRISDEINNSVIILLILFHLIIFL